MPNYQKMYAIVCAAASSAVDQMPSCPACDAARATLLDALERAEEIYINEGKLICLSEKNGQGRTPSSERR